jgi:hypothetical protein
LFECFNLLSDDTAIGFADSGIEGDAVATATAPPTVSVDLTLEFGDFCDQYFPD